MRHSIIVPTYRRQDVLESCLECLAALDYDRADFEVRVYDNGGELDSREVVERFQDQLQLTYTLNPPGHGMGYSVVKGAHEARGDFIIELNDDALVPPSFLRDLEETFASDPTIGIVGVRAEEDGYISQEGAVGSIDLDRLRVVGNFDENLGALTDVEHVYGFCYAYRRELFDVGIEHDSVLLSKDYSSANRIETDHCLAAKRAGYRVVYNPQMVVTHLAKPRADMSEVSLRWRINHIRNTLYLFLKHYGLTGGKAASMRFALSHDVGFFSAVRRPSFKNLAYFFAGVRVRSSAFFHYFKFQLTGRPGFPRGHGPGPNHPEHSQSE